MAAKLKPHTVSSEREKSGRTKEDSQNWCPVDIRSRLGSTNPIICLHGDETDKQPRSVRAASDTLCDPTEAEDDLSAHSDK